MHTGHNELFWNIWKTRRDDNNKLMSGPAVGPKNLNLKFDGQPGSPPFWIIGAMVDRVYRNGTGGSFLFGNQRSLHCLPDLYKHQKGQQTQVAGFKTEK